MLLFSLLVAAFLSLGPRNPAFANASVCQKAYESYLNDAYVQAVELFEECVQTSENPHHFYLLALSYFSLHDYPAAKKYALLAGKLDPQMKRLQKNDYFNLLTDIHDRLVEQKLLHSRDDWSWILVLLTIVSFGGIVFLFRFRRTRQKLQSIHPQLHKSIQELNDEFHYLKQEILTNPTPTADFSELEDRCLIINDRFEQCKTQKSDQEGICKEIEVTRELIRNYIHKHQEAHAYSTQKSTSPK